MMADKQPANVPMVKQVIATALLIPVSMDRGRPNQPLTILKALLATPVHAWQLVKNVALRLEKAILVVVPAFAKALKGVGVVKMRALPTNVQEDTVPDGWHFLVTA